MIGAEMSAFLRVSKALWNSSVNWKGTSLARRLVRGLDLGEVRDEPSIESGMAKEASDSFYVDGRRKLFNDFYLRIIHLYPSFGH